MNPKRWFAVVLVCALCLVGCSSQSDLADKPSPTPQQFPIESETLSEATFAGGCFWCMEKPFDELPGVSATTSGYTGGAVSNPTYQQVSSGQTKHAEAVRVIYDPEQVSYDELLDVFWANVDPLDEYGQFCDRGSQYRAEIFYHDDAQKEAAETSLKTLTDDNKFEQPIATQIAPVSEFYVAEDYHQDFYITSPVRYKSYRFACGRDKRLAALWGDKG